MADRQAQRLAAERAAMARPKGPAPVGDTYDTFRQRQREVNAVAGVEGDQSVDETLAGAGQTLNRTRGRAESLAAMDAMAPTAAPAPEPMSTGAKLAEVANLAAMPAAMLLGGPAGWAAGAGMAGKALYDAYNSDEGLGAGDVAMGLIGTVPGARALPAALRGLKRGTAAAKTVAPAAAPSLGALTASRPAMTVPGQQLSMFDDLARGGDEVASGAGRTRQGLTDELNSLDDTTLAADRQWQAANPAMPKVQPRRPASLEAMGAGGLDDVADDALSLVDDVEVPQGMGSMDDVAEMISGMQSVPTSQRLGGIRGDQFRGAREHGIAGFHDLPEMSSGEVERMRRNIERVMSKRGQ